MTRQFAAACVVLMLAAPALAQQPATAKEKSMPAPIVFFDIAGPDFASQKAFYKTVFGWEFDPIGRFNTPVTSGPSLPALLRIDPTEKGHLSRCRRHQRNT